MAGIQTPALSVPSSALKELRTPPQELGTAPTHSRSGVIGLWTFRVACSSCYGHSSAGAGDIFSPKHKPHLGRKRYQALKVLSSSETTSTEQTPSPLKPKRLILLRHAKSSWEDSTLRDHDRPLSKRGRSAAGKIALKLKELGWLPDLILCSDALRTRQTLDLMCEAVSEFHQPAVHFLGSFYSVAATDGHTAQHMEEMVLRFGQAEFSTVMCMGHNRGWEEAASKFAGSQVELKTANAALLECANSRSEWEEAFQAGWLLKAVAKPDE